MPIKSRSHLYLLQVGCTRCLIQMYQCSVYMELLFLYCILEQSWSILQILICLSGAEVKFIHAIDAIIAKLKDPQVAYIISSSNNLSSETLQPVIIRGAELTGYTGDATSIDPIFRSCGNFCVERKTIPPTEVTLHIQHLLIIKIISIL